MDKQYTTMQIIIWCVVCTLTSGGLAGGGVYWLMGSELGTVAISDEASCIRRLDAKDVQCRFEKIEHEQAHQWKKHVEDDLAGRRRLSRATGKDFTIEEIVPLEHEAHEGGK